MARLTFPADIVDLRKYAAVYADMETSLRFYFNHPIILGGVRFLSYTNAEVSGELNNRLAELDKTASMTVLAALEAAFRTDYLQRCYKKERDPLSREFREIYKRKIEKTSLEDDILTTWKANTLGATEILGALKGAFKFRHWTAHGRYWEPKLGQQYDYVTVYNLATSILTQFPLYKS
jgi:hypothetical protein